MRSTLLAVSLLAALAGTDPSDAQDPEKSSIASPVGASAAERFREDARSIETLVNDKYAYRERLPGERLSLSPELRAEGERVADRRSLLRFAERVLLTLADHHAITGASFPDSWSVVPSYSDLWIEFIAGDYVIDAVRAGSPAEQRGIRKGDRLLASAGVPIDQAVNAFWADLGLPLTRQRATFAARILAAGRRDRPRLLKLQRSGSSPVQMELPNLYSASRERPPVSAHRSGRDMVIKINDALGNSETVDAFDEAMGKATPGERIVIDLTDTPSGGNTVVARAIMGWFVTKPTAYQVHRLPSEERQSGIARQWVEQVLPRAGKRHGGPVLVRVGRWTGSMGEGLAIGLDAIGAKVVGHRMAGLLGAIYDYRLPTSGLVLKLPTERLSAVSGTPREEFIPRER